MMRLARSPLLVVVLLLASVGSASAECAWVLWSYASATAPGGTSGASSTPTEAKFFAERAKSTQSDESDDGTSPGSPGT